jgi:hypothetical protein
MYALNRPDSLGNDMLSAANTEHALDTYRRLTAAGYGETDEEYRPDLALTNQGPEYFGSEFYGGEEFGGLFGSIAKGISSVAKTATSTVSKGVSTLGKVPGVSTAFAPARLVRDVARGKNVIGSVRSQAESVVRDTRKSLPLAASVVSVVPGVGTGVGVGLSALASASEGKSLREIAEDAALGAIPGGPLVKSGLRAGINIARGENVIKSVGREGIEYAKTQLPGGQFVQQAVTAGVNVARGQNLMTAAAPVAQQFLARGLAKSGPGGAVLQFARNAPPKAVAATVTQVMRAAQSQNPQVLANVRQVIANTQNAARSGNPAAAMAVNTLQRAATQRLNQMFRR